MGKAWMVVLMILAGLPALAQDNAPTISARFDRQTVYEGDSAVLRIEVANARLEDEPDFSVLEPDFVIGQTGTNSSMSIINGRKEYRTEWNVLLEPRRTGEISLPPIRVGPFETEPLTLTVMRRPQGSGPQGRDVFLEVEATPDQPYVHSQVLFVIRLYHAPSILEGQLGEPAGMDAVVERLGDDTDYRTVVEGESYRVIERRYALFPERSGTLVLPEIRFQGRVADRSQRGTGFNSLFSRGRLVSVKSEPVVLNVRPRPPAFGAGNWLPAAALELKEVWPNGEPTFRVGEPVTRTLVTEARGLLSAQLPEFQLEPPEGAKLYPDQPVTQSRTDGQWVLGRREDRFAIVPVSAGTLRLPEIRIPWWDTANDRLAEAVIPARTFEVLPAAEGQMTSVPPLPESAIVAESTDSTAEGWSGDSTPWRVATAALALLWLVTLAAWLRARRGPQPLDAAASRPVSAPAPAPPSLKKACRDRDPGAAARALLAQAKAGGHPVRSLGQLAPLLEDPEQEAAVQALDRWLYRDADADWDGNALMRHVGRGLVFRGAGAKAPPPVLPPLYGEH